MRYALMAVTGLFSGICFGVAVFWAPDIPETLFWAALGLLGGLWGKYVDDRAYGG